MWDLGSDNFLGSAQRCFERQDCAHPKHQPALLACKQRHPRRIRTARRLELKCHFAVSPPPAALQPAASRAGAGRGLLGLPALAVAVCPRCCATLGPPANLATSMRWQPAFASQAATDSKRKGWPSTCTAAALGMPMAVSKVPTPLTESCDSNIERRTWWALNARPKHCRTRFPCVRGG